jgi:hypothetical protein
MTMPISKDDIKKYKLSEWEAKYKAKFHKEYPPVALHVKGVKGAVQNMKECIDRGKPEPSAPYKHVM